MKLYSHPKPPGDFREFVSRAHTGPFSGYVVLTSVLFLTFLLALLFVASLYTRAPVGEVRVRPRSRRMAMWERFARPYALRNPRRRTPSSGEASTH